MSTRCGTVRGRRGRRDRPGRGAHSSPGFARRTLAARRRRINGRRARRRARKTAFGRHPFRTGFLVVVLLLTPVWWSLGSALANPVLGPTVSGRAAEWARDHGMSSIVAWAENFWYSHHQPAVGGAPPKGAIPPPTDATTTPTHTTTPSGPHVSPLPTPPPLKPFVNPPIAGEGEWHPVGRTVDGYNVLYTAFLRPDAVHTSLVAGVAWMDMRLLRATLYSGSYIPGGGPFTYTAPISNQAAKTLVAEFNSGFRMQDTNGGYYTDGKLLYPMRTGGASFVIYKNGSVNIGAWGSEVRMTPDVFQVRQNVDMLVDNGKIASNLNADDTTQWGLTLGNQVFVPRLGVGITSNGALVVVAGVTDIVDIANLLVRAGAVRGMELDINPGWVDFGYYTPSTPTGLATPANGHNLLNDGSMPGDGPAREFYSWWSRDFFTISARYP